MFYVVAMSDAMITINVYVVAMSTSMVTINVYVVAMNASMVTMNVLCCNHECCYGYHKYCETSFS